MRDQKNRNSTSEILVWWTTQVLTLRCAIPPECFFDVSLTLRRIA